MTFIFSDKIINKWRQQSKKQSNIKLYKVNPNLTLINYEEVLRRHLIILTRTPIGHNILTHEFMLKKERS